MCDRECLETLEQAHNWPFQRRIPLPVPTTLLLDGQGRFMTIYRGPVSVDTICNDRRLCDLSRVERQAAALPFAGRWHSRPDPKPPIRQGVDLLAAGDVGDAADFVRRNLELLRRHREFPLLTMWLAQQYLDLDQVDQALPYLRWASQYTTDDPTVMNNLAWQYATHPDPRVRDPAEALRWALRAARATSGNNAYVLGTLSVAHAENGQFNEAISAGERARTIAQAQGMRALLDSLDERLERFRAGKPYRSENR